MSILKLTATAIVEYDGEIIDSVGTSPPPEPTDEPSPELLEAHAIAKPTKNSAICWQIIGWNNAHLKTPPRERGAMLAHPTNMAARTFILDGSTVHLLPNSIKIDGEGRAFVINDAVEAKNSAGDSVEIVGGLYLKDTEIGF